MRHSKILTVLVLRIWFALLVLTAMCPGMAQADGSPSSVAARIAGTYLITDSSTGVMRLITLTSDGNFITTSSFEVEFQFSTGRGVWKQSETDFFQIKGKSLNFNFDVNGAAVVEFVLNFDSQFRTVSGEFFGRVFPTGVDPLNPSGAPLRSFVDHVTGRRITAD